MTSFKDILASQILMPLLDWKRGKKNGRYVKDVSAIQNSSLECMRQHQLTRLRIICENAAKIPLYKSRFDAAGIQNLSEMTFSDFAKIEPFGREDIRALGAYLKDNGKVDENTLESATGGTTSAPVSFYMTKDCANHRWSATRFFNALLGFVPGKKIAYFWGAHQDNPDYDSKLKTYLMQNWFERSKFIPASRLSEAQLMDAYKQLKKFRPCLLQGYPSGLYILSQFMLERNLSLKVPAVTCTAEAGTDVQKDAIEKAFGVRPINWYGARDAGRIATECEERNGLHLNTYGLYVETNSDAGPGRLLITDLWNDLMPIIRYDIGDLAEIDDSPCKCGSAAPRLVDVGGRVADILVASGGRLVPGLSFTNRIIKGSDEVKEMQLIQYAMGQFGIKVVPAGGYNGEKTNQPLRDKFDELMGEKCTVEIELVEEIPLEASGKKRFCINKMPEDELKQYV